MNVKNVCLNDLNQLKHPMCIDSEVPLDFLIKKVAKLGGSIFLGFAGFYEFVYFCSIVNRMQVANINRLELRITNESRLELKMFFLFNTLLTGLSIYLLKN
jgi:hypothetical protein